MPFCLPQNLLQAKSVAQLTLFQHSGWQIVHSFEVLLWTIFNLIKFPNSTYIAIFTFEDCNLKKSQLYFLEVLQDFMEDFPQTQLSEELNCQKELFGVSIEKAYLKVLIIWRVQPPVTCNPSRMISCWFLERLIFRDL